MTTISAAEARGVPSPLALETLQSLVGAPLEDAGGALGSGSWSIGRFRGDSPTGASVALERGLDHVLVPIRTDADVADLARRVAPRGTRPEAPGAGLSPAYRDFWLGR